MWICASTISMSISPSCLLEASCLFEVDPVGPVVEIDQYRESMARAGPPARGLRHRFGRLARELARRRIAVETDPGEDLGEGMRYRPPAEDLLDAGQVGEARRDLSARERLDDRERALSRRERRQDHALEGLLVLGHDEVAEALAHFALHRRQLRPHVVHVAAADGQLGL